MPLKRRPLHRRFEGFFGEWHKTCSIDRVSARSADRGEAMPAAWKKYLTNLSFAEPARYAIVESWARSSAAVGGRNQEPKFTQVQADEFSRRLMASADFLNVAIPHLCGLMRNLPGQTHVAYITDADGIVLHSLGDQEQIQMFGLSPGFDWSESTMGTNGVGTALATKTPVAVVGDEHYLRAFENCTCTAAPISDPLASSSAQLT